MKRLAIGVLLAAAMAAVFLYTGVTRDTEYRRLVAAGDDALGYDQVFLALEAFSGAIALKSESMLAYLKRGETYQRRGDLGAALRDLTRASALAPEATRPLERLGDVSQALGRHEEAAGHYAAYVARDDRAPRVLYKLALAHYRAGRTTRTIPLLRQMVELVPEMAEAHYLLGLSMWDQDRLNPAIEALTRAVTLSPGFTTAREALSGVFAAAAGWKSRSNSSRHWPPSRRTVQNGMWRSGSPMPASAGPTWRCLRWDALSRSTRTSCWSIRPSVVSGSTLPGPRTTASR